jgi:hypothetical protein
LGLRDRDLRMTPRAESEISILGGATQTPMPPCSGNSMVITIKYGL